MDDDGENTHPPQTIRVFPTFNITMTTCSSRLQKKEMIGILRFLLCLIIAVSIRLCVPKLLVGSLTSMMSSSYDTDDTTLELLHTTNTEEGPSLCPHCDSIDDSSTLVEKHRRLNIVTPPMTPQFVGNWERLVDFPVTLGEAHGGLIGNKELLVTGGFINFTTVNRHTYVLDIRAPNLLLHGKTNRTLWKRLDDYPYNLGITHAAEAFHGNYMYICGGYDGYPGPVKSDCFVFNRKATRNRQYTSIRLPNLPEPRAGGGLTYDITHNALIFVGGTRRNVTKDKITIYDTNTTFILYLNHTSAGWTRNARPKPYTGNHISFVTVNDTCSGSSTSNGIQRHYFFGGQVGQNESKGNINYLYVYMISNDTWIPRKFMPFGRGHTGTSSMAYGCGFVVAGGAINTNSSNGKLMTDDVSYYNSYTDTWTAIGKLYKKMKTPICSIAFIPTTPVGKHYMFCTTGYRSYTYRREIKLVWTAEVKKYI